jgi:hypothetical protein
MSVDIFVQLSFQPTQQILRAAGMPRIISTMSMELHIWATVIKQVTSLQPEQIPPSSKLCILALVRSAHSSGFHFDSCCNSEERLFIFVIFFYF